MIKRNYWNKNIKPLPADHSYTDADRVKIGKNLYYGRKLNGRSEKAKIIACRILPILLLSILPPLALAFACTGVYRKTLKQMQEVKHDRKLKHISDIANGALGIAPHILDLFAGEENFKKLPILDIGKRIGGTDYIDFITPEELEHPIMRGVDVHGRPFFVLRAYHTKLNQDVSAAFFQRYPDNKDSWTKGGRYGKHHFPEIVGNYSKDLADLKTLITKMTLNDLEIRVNLTKNE